MALQHLLLGPILFQDFELPASIGWGGSHSLAIHRLPGGARVIDAMGRDDADISWSGIFTGPDATFRARALDLMRAEGLLWPLTWESFFYSVVLARFEADYRRPNWIPYRLTCTVLRDEAAAVAEYAISLAATTAQDLAQAASLAPANVPADLDVQMTSTTDPGQASVLAGQAAQQAAANGYLARAARNAAAN